MPPGGPEEARAGASLPLWGPSSLLLLRDKGRGSWARRPHDRQRGRTGPLLDTPPPMPVPYACRTRAKH